MRQHNAIFAPHFGNIINEVMNTSFDNMAKSAKAGLSIPAANITQKDDQFILTMALPGYSKEDIKIQTERNRITISSEKTSTDEQKYRLKEYNYGTFSRDFRIPRDIDKESIAATFENGLLSLVFNKKPEAKAKNITIQ